MASARNLRTINLFNRKPQILSSLFGERWLTIWDSQDRTYKSTTFISCDLVTIKSWLRSCFSTQSRPTDEPVTQFRANTQKQNEKVLDASCDVRCEQQKPLQGCQLPPNNCEDLLRAWGCNDQDISRIFELMPSLHTMKLKTLQSKLKTFQDLGISSSDLVKIISCRPRLLKGRINLYFEERIGYLESLFGSRQALQKAIIRNPSLLTYDLEKNIKPVVELYRSMGFSREDFTLMLRSRPTIIPRSSLNSEKLEYIRRTGVSKDSKMYKYVVTLIAISRLETLREKIANLEKFGLMEDEVFQLFSSSPFLLTLSVDKVQRNMTYVVASMKQPASVVLRYPFLLLNNLEAVMKPRTLLAGKIDDMGLVPRIAGPKLFTAMRMKEERFVRAFIKCHPEEVSEKLMDYYRDVKCVRRLAEASKRNARIGFPF